MGYPKGNVGDLVKQYLKPGDVAIDVGACKGEITKIMAGIVGDAGHVFALEPNPDLKDSVRANNVTWKQFAAWRVHTTLTLYRSSQTPEENSLWQNSVRVYADCVDACGMLLDDVTDDDVDLVKLDAQGAEADILDGAKGLLSRCPVWIVEVWPIGLKHAGKTPRDVLNKLRDAGLLVKWADGRPVWIEHLDDWSDKPTFVNWVAVRG